MAMKPRLLFLICTWLVCGFLFAATPTEQQEVPHRAQIEQWLASGNMAAIEDLAESHLASKARFENGMWLLSLLYGDFRIGVGTWAKNEADWDQLNSALIALAARRPMAWMLYAQFLNARAWSIRGGKYANETDKQALIVFESYIDRERRILDEHKPELSMNPAWYSRRLTAATEGSDGEDFSARIFKEGSQRHPSYSAIYTARFRNRTSKWSGGSNDELFDYLDVLARLGETDAAEGIFARVMIFADEMEPNLIYHDRIDRAALRKSILALTTSYPAQSNIRETFLLACKISDKTLATGLLAQIVDPPPPEATARQLSFYRLCGNWASGRIPSFTLQEREGDKLVRHIVR
jgi:hypothetical protein